MTATSGDDFSPNGPGVCFCHKCERVFLPEMRPVHRSYCDGELAFIEEEFLDLRQAGALYTLIGERTDAELTLILAEADALLSDVIDYSEPERG